MTYIDISVGIKDGMLVWPGDKAVEVGWDAKMADGHESNVSYIRMGRALWNPYRYAFAFY